MDDRVRPTAEPPCTARGVLGAGAVLAGTTGLLAVVAAWHVTQGTSAVGGGDLLRLLTGDADPVVRDVFVASRLPRLLAGLVVGLALGAAGAVFSSLARNALAAPDTLAVNAGAFLAIALVTVAGISLPVLGEGAVAFVGALAAAGTVLLLAGAGGASTTRLVLAGSALTLALSSVTAALLLLFDQETGGLYAWGNGVLTQLDLGAVTRVGPVVALGLVAALLLARRLDLLAAGDDLASVLGVPVRATRVLGTLVAVVLSAAAVTLAGPIGFVGLCAPAAVRLVARWVPAVTRHAVLVPLAGLAGAVIVLASDAGLRSVLGAEGALRIPTGVTTTLLGAVVLVVLARRSRDSGPTRTPPAARPPVPGSSRRYALVVMLLLVATAGAALLGMLAGFTWLLTGDLLLWAQDRAVPVVAFAADERFPRVLAALLAGAALALAGTVVQAVCRNPLAEPGILGITGGAGVGAVLVVTSTATVVSTAAISLAAGVGAVLAFALVYAVSWRGGLDSDRLVLVGIGVQAGTLAVTTFLLIRADPWNTPRLFTWLSGSTYDRDLEQVLPVAVALALALPTVWLAHRRLDLLAVDDDTPRLVGVRLEVTRLAALGAAAVLTSTAVSAVGVVAFVGLVAPHAARALVSGRHARVVPVAALLGALLLSLADTVGRTVVAPAQVPAGLVVALVGTPYFLHLLARSRTRATG
nr:iron ABC transporter permease [Nocardioides perillae]